ncbi:hypothetical protein [Tumebacillus flagellatus]|uniref:Bacterial spore germination immunoglobulin-like domain-containing protein n=1 Tax=Tumebacillus flagellatus TaxID=1157490 RepID=A0A074M5J5_9BACL|nr:hypothetical protein [Tumebacillus flagellatus]KEO81267.1 hypothetical protein EL26_21555 [Tumebacillus flagellatus]
MQIVTSKTFRMLSVLVALAALWTLSACFEAQEESVVHSPNLLESPPRIGITSASYPVHPGQKFSFHSTGGEWEGTQVTLFLISDDPVSLSQISDYKVIPQNATQIGSTELKNGAWSFDWQLPAAASVNQSFLLTARTDRGTIHTARFDSLQYDILEVSPSIAHAGESVHVHGVGFGAYRSMQPRLIQVRPETNFDLLHTFPVVYSNDGSFDFSLTLPASAELKLAQQGHYELNFKLSQSNGQAETVSAQIEIQ